MTAAVIAVSTTLKITNEQAMAVGEAIDQAAKAVLCQEK